MHQLDKLSLVLSRGNLCHGRFPQLHHSLAVVFFCVNFQWKIAYACLIGKLFIDIRVKKVNIFGVNFFNIFLRIVIFSTILILANTILKIFREIAKDVEFSLKLETLSIYQKVSCF